MDDIDQADADDPLACTEYVNEQYEHYREKECRPGYDPGYMAKQTAINGRMRSILIDWLVRGNPHRALAQKWASRREDGVGDVENGRKDRRFFVRGRFCRHPAHHSPGQGRKVLSGETVVVACPRWRSTASSSAARRPST